MNKEVNVYSFYDECYVYLNDYAKLQQKVKQLEKENQELREKIIDKKYEILEFIKENKVKRYRVTLSEDYDEEILLAEDDIDALERIVKNEYDYENK